MVVGTDIRPGIGSAVTDEEYERLALEDRGRLWELHDGRIREKPGMTWEHGGIVAFLGYLLQHQLDRRQFQVRINEGRVRRIAGRISIPDLIVVPTALGAELRGKPGKLAIFDRPLPLVVEAWSSSTGKYDVEEKLAEYRARGQDEIWYPHPYDRTISAWRRQADGSYEMTIHRDGVIRPASLPGVEIELAVLFDV